MTSLVSRRLAAAEQHVARLVAELDEANERIRQLEEQAMPRSQEHPLSKEAGLTRAESTLFHGMLNMPVLRREQAVVLLYGNEVDMPDSRVFDVFIHRLRQKLRPHDVTISTARNVGWVLEGRERLLKEM